MKTEFHLSPSLCHQHLISRMSPALGYQGGEVRDWQRRFRRKLGELLGIPHPKRVPLKVRSLWKRPLGAGVVEKIVFTSEPFADVPAYVCLPGKAKPPYVFFICLQGHSTGMHVSLAVDREDENKPFRVEGDRDFALGCMERGIAALCIEQRSMGTRLEKAQKRVAPHSGCHDATMRALILGRTLIGERVFDVDRGIDYLVERGDVDLKRIGVMGNSGGGTISMFSAALLPRIAFAMPSCYFCTFRDSLMSIYHCEDNYVPGLYRYGEMWDVMGLFAPRPVVIVAGRKDEIFPLAGVQRAFRELKRIYRAAGAGGNCQLVIGGEGHRFYAREGWARMLAAIGCSRE